MHNLNEPVSRLMVDVAKTVVLPLFRRMTPDDMIEKSPGELVTVADRQAEILLRDGLAGLDGGARIVGEEAVSEDASLLDDIGSGAVWIIDPIDGTRNYANGVSPFGIMVALVQDGETQAGWIYDPVARRMCHAARAGGAWINGHACRITPGNRTRPVASLATQFMSAQIRAGVHAAAEREFDLTPIPGCAAEHYPRLALGHYDVSLFQRTLPWDHAAGGLFLQESGGMVARWDGSPYRIGDGGSGLLVARDRYHWDLARTALFNDHSGLAPQFAGLRLRLASERDTEASDQVTAPLKSPQTRDMA